MLSPHQPHPTCRTCRTLPALPRHTLLCSPLPQAYVPWNWHEPYPGQYEWQGWADVERWMQLIQVGDEGGSIRATQLPS